jgi:hypothetical protein
MFELNKNNSEEEYVSYTTANGYEINFIPSIATIITKYSDIFDLANEFLEFNPVLKHSYDEFLYEYGMYDDPAERMKIFMKHYEKILSEIDQTYESINLKQKIKVKVTASVVSITRKEAEIIVLTSVRYRFFLLCYLSKNLYLTNDDLTIFHNILCKEFNQKHIHEKIFNIIKSMVSLTNKADRGKKSIWKLFSDSTGITPEAFQLELYNLIFYKGIPSLIPDDNPIAFLTVLAKNKLEWLLKTNTTYVGISDTNSDMTNMISAKNSDIFETQMFYKIITKDVFIKLAKNYKNYNKLHSFNVYCILNTISAPMIHILFKKNIRALSFSSHMLNFLTHKILTEVDIDKIILRSLLLSVPLINRSEEVQRTLPEDLLTYLYSKLTKYEQITHIVHFNITTIKKCFVESISLIYEHDFYNISLHNENLTLININWFKFIDELVDYIYNIITGKYTDIIEKYEKIIFNYEEDMEEDNNQIDILDLLNSYNTE